MTDLDQSGNVSDPSAEAPVVTTQAPDLDAIVQRIVGETDKRFQGFQSMMDRKLGDVTRQFESKLKTVGLSQEEREQLDSETEAQETQRLKQEIALLRLRKDKPDAVDFFMEVMGAESLEDQLAVIEQKLGAKAAAQVADQVANAPDGTPQAPEIDRNSPSRTKSAGMSSALEGGADMTDELAQTILESGSKGILSRLRRGNQD